MAAPRPPRPSVRKRKLAAALAEGAAELRRIRRLFSFARPYRGLLYFYLLLNYQAEQGLLEPLRTPDYLIIAKTHLVGNRRFT